VGEGEISYGGPNARARAELAAETLRARLAPEFAELRVDLIGLSSLHGRPLHAVGEPYEIRVRVAGRAGIREKAERVGEEVEALWTNGPGGGGGARKNVREQIGVVSTLIERERVRPGLHVTEVRGEEATV
ncbi:MAG: acyclic terpene utilization AtuA family protein, partial [Burkholderiales bacterium]